MKRNVLDSGDPLHQLHVCRGNSAETKRRMATTDMKNTIQVGDVVKLKSGGPKMTIHSISKHAGALCAYFNDSKLDVAKVSLETLDLVPENFPVNEANKLDGPGYTVWVFKGVASPKLAIAAMQWVFENHLGKNFSIEVGGRDLTVKVQP